MKSVMTVMLLVFLFTAAFSAQDIKVLETGVFHGEEVDVKNGDIWLGVFKRGDSFMLMPSILSVETVYDPITDPKGESSGVSINVPGLGEPFFLIKGLGFEQARPVTNSELTDLEIGPAFDTTFEFNGEEYRLRIESPGDGSGDFLGNYSKLILSNKNKIQTLYNVEECSFCRWRVDWAGDLDSDGKPDFYLYLTDHYNVANQKLFLSSKAESGRLVKEVAEFVTTGC